jgi:hypothetical protein
VTSAFPISWLTRRIHAQLGTFRNPHFFQFIYHTGFKSSSWSLTNWDRSFDQLSR